MTPSEEAAPRASPVALGADRAERDEILRRFGGNLTERRVTQRTLSENCFLTPKGISNLECGQLTPSLLVLLMPCHTLGTSLGELMEGVGAPTRQASCLLARQLIKCSPGISTAEIADCLDLPFSYIFRGARRMASLGEIRGRSGSWQPALDGLFSLLSNDERSRRWLGPPTGHEAEGLGRCSMRPRASTRASMLLLSAGHGRRTVSGQGIERHPPIRPMGCRPGCAG
jgi:transcriptional regulator with XRE-family HTH domain